MRTRRLMGGSVSGKKKEGQSVDTVTHRSKLYLEQWDKIISFCRSKVGEIHYCYIYYIIHSFLMKWHKFRFIQKSEILIFWKKKKKSYVFQWKRVAINFQRNLDCSKIDGTRMFLDFVNAVLRDREGRKTRFLAVANSTSI